MGQRDDMTEYDAFVDLGKLGPRRPQPARGSETCTHGTVQVELDFARIENKTNEYAADIRISCVDCGVPFRFKGLPGGVSMSRPMVGINGEELRAPMEAAYVEELVFNEQW